MVNEIIWQGDPVRAPRCVLSTKITHTGNSSPDYHSHMAERDTLVALIEELALKSYASGRLLFKRQGVARYDGVWEIYWLSDADAMALKIAWEG
jgi:hypothetical protein